MTTYARVPTTFVELVEPFDADVQGIAAELRDVIRTVNPDADEKVYGGLKIANVLYSLGSATNVVCGIQPTGTHCKLYLHHVRPGDVPGLKIEGSGKNVRHVKIGSAAQARSAEVSNALERAREGARGGGG